MKSISMMEFKNKLSENIDIIDVREHSEYSGGHIPGAVNMPLSNISYSYETLDKDKTYYIVCYSGARSERAALFLSYKGFEVVSVEGGMANWDGELSY